ncbi:hypothetical protein V1478_017741 [Vespula squamosa]|uniref:Uncharacterized protein n=1 Tax=Vespula squamosa TaxID=30214 RepID=A0ABD1ZWP1_VESSQ
MTDIVDIKILTTSYTNILTNSSEIRRLYTIAVADKSVEISLRRYVNISQKVLSRLCSVLLKR